MEKMTAQQKFQYVLIAEVGDGKKYSRNSLSEKTNISRQTIGNIINGLPSTLYNMQCILDALGYEITITKKENTDETGN